VSDYRFEIVPHGYGRYGWLLAEYDPERREAILRSRRGYRTKKKARKAIAKLQEIVARAVVVDAMDGDDSSAYALPVGQFHLVPGVLPLPTQGSPVSHALAEARGRGCEARHAQAPASIESIDPLELEEDNVDDAGEGAQEDVQGHQLVATEEVEGTVSTQGSTHNEVAEPAATTDAADGATTEGNNVTANSPENEATIEGTDTPKERGSVTTSDQGSTEPSEGRTRPARSWGGRGRGSGSG